MVCVYERFYYSETVAKNKEEETVDTGQMDEEKKFNFKRFQHAGKICSTKAHILLLLRWPWAALSDTSKMYDEYTSWSNGHKYKSLVFVRRKSIGNIVSGSFWNSVHKLPMNAIHYRLEWSIESVSIWRNSGWVSVTLLRIRSAIFKWIVMRIQNKCRMNKMCRCVCSTFWWNFRHIERTYTDNSCQNGLFSYAKQINIAKYI